MKHKQAYFIPLFIVNFVGITFVLFWLVIIEPVYIIGISFILIGANMLFFFHPFSRGRRESVKFGKYEIFRK